MPLRSAFLLIAAGAALAACTPAAPPDTRATAGQPASAVPAPLVTQACDAGRPVFSGSGTGSVANATAGLPTVVSCDEGKPQVVYSNPPGGNLATPNANLNQTPLRSHSD